MINKVEFEVAVVPMRDFLAFGSSASRWEIQIVEIDDGTYDDEFSSVHLCLGLETSYRLPSKI
jgi:hypothetical protein